MNKSPHSPHSFLTAVNDIIGATLLVIWGIILGPLGLLRGTLYFGNVFWYVWILSPQGLLSRFVRAAIDWRLGNFDAAVFQLEFLVTRLEVVFLKSPQSRTLRIVLEDFYTLLVRSYLHGGHIDDAMLVVLRAKKHLDCERLPEMARLDAKTAHLVRAGLAAGRLLEGGGLATLYVKSHENPPMTPNAPKKKPTILSPLERQGATAAPRDGLKPSSKVIPFPTPAPVPQNPAPPER